MVLGGGEEVEDGETNSGCAGQVLGYYPEAAPMFSHMPIINYSSMAPMRRNGARAKYHPQNGPWFCSIATAG